MSLIFRRAKPEVLAPVEGRDDLRFTLRLDRSGQWLTLEQRHPRKSHRWLSRAARNVDYRSNTLHEAIELERRRLLADLVRVEAFHAKRTAKEQALEDFYAQLDPTLRSLASVR
jgi:hypothetical protein